MKKLLIDTDIGTDIDDALALVMAAKSCLAEICGVTTVTGNTAARADIANHLLRLCGRPDIPIAAGTAECTNRPPQYLPQIQSQAGYPEAVEFILDTVKANPDLTIVTLGPLTNIAKCISCDPKAMRDATLVMMGGMLTKPFPEGNISADPEAARIVFGSAAERVMIGLDVTAALQFRDADLRRVLCENREPHASLYQMLRYWKQDVLGPLLRSWGTVVTGADYPAAAGMHDPITVGFTLWPELFRMRKACVAVETEGRYARGCTLEQVNPFWESKPSGDEISVAQGLDTEQFYKRFLACLTA